MNKRNPNAVEDPYPSVIKLHTNTTPAITIAVVTGWAFADKVAEIYEEICAEETTAAGRVLNWIKKPGKDGSSAEWWLVPKTTS